MAESLVLPAHSETDYHGASISIEKEFGVVVLVLGSFRSGPRSDETHEQIQEIFEDLPYRKLLIDHREARWPLSTNELAQRFRAQATNLPPLKVGVLCNDREDEVVVLGAEIFRRAGHEVLVSTSEAEILAFLG